MFKLKEYNNKNYVGYALSISNPDEYYASGDCATRYCLLNFRFGSHSWWWMIPEIFKPKKQWEDTSKYPWHTSKEGGYWNYISRMYGFIIQDEHVHIQYGIQPGFWCSTDKKNSDHAKLFEIPWKTKRLVRHSFISPDWKVEYELNPEKLGREYLNHIQYTREVVNKIKIKFNDFDGEEIIATCCIEEHQYDHGTGWFKWLKYFIKPEIIRKLDIDFNKEVGYEKGSGKGGITGHSIVIHYKEDPLDAFKRYGSEEDRYKNHGIKNRNFSNIQLIN
jgi:hypothetical protein